MKWKLPQLPNQWQSFCLVLILIAAIFLRFYNFANTLLFQGDQGRDALIVSQIFKAHDLVFIGPMTSVGNMYLGPLYYYFMLPFLWLSYPSPLGPAYAVAALSVITVYSIFWITRKMFSVKTAWYTSIFYTFSYGVIMLARFSWNPNIAPFFSLFMFYFTYLAWKKNLRYWLVVSALFSILIQLHYVTLLSAAGAGCIFLIQLFEQRQLHKKTAHAFRHLWQNYLPIILASIGIFILSLTPLVLFDIKHDFLNSRSFITMFSHSDNFNIAEKTQLHGWAAVHKFLFLDLKDRASQVLFEPSFKVDSINHPLLYLVLVATAFYVFKNRKKLTAAEIVLAAYLVTGILGITFYQNAVYLHYLAYLFPMVYIFYGHFFSKLPRFFSPLCFTIFFLFFLYKSWPLYPLRSNSWTIFDMQNTAQQIYQRVQSNDRYNLVLLSESKDLYGMNYRYFLSTFPHEPVALAQAAQSNTLFIINEEKKESDVASLPIYEIVTFPDHQVKDFFSLPQGPEITVLRVSN